MYVSVCVHPCKSVLFFCFFRTEIPAFIWIPHTFQQFGKVLTGRSSGFPTLHTPTVTTIICGHWLHGTVWEPRLTLSMCSSANSTWPAGSPRADNIYRWRDLRAEQTHSRRITNVEKMGVDVRGENHLIWYHMDGNQFRQRPLKLHRRCW